MGDDRPPAGGAVRWALRRPRTVGFSSVRSIPREAVVDILYGTIATTENLATMELEGGHARREPLRDTARRVCDGVCRLVGVRRVSASAAMLGAVLAAVSFVRVCHIMDIVKKEKKWSIFSFQQPNGACAKFHR